MFCQDQKKNPLLFLVEGYSADSTIPGFYNMTYLTAGGFILASPLHCGHNQLLFCPFTTKETPRAKPLLMFKLLSLNYSKS